MAIRRFEKQFKTGDMIMKKLAKIFAVLCTAIPVAALSACNPLNAVSDENKLSVYQDYAAKLTASLTEMLTGDTYLNSYTSVMFNTQSGEDSARLEMRMDGDFDFTDAVVTRMSQKVTIEQLFIEGGTELEGGAEMRAYLNSDGLYQYNQETIPGNDALENKSFITLEELTASGLPTLEDSIPLPQGFDSAEAFLSLYGGAEWFTAEDGTKLQIKSNATTYNAPYYREMLELLGGEGINVQMEQTITLTFDKQGNVLFFEYEIIANATSTTNPPQTEGGNEEAALQNEEQPEDLPEDGETNGEENTQPETESPANNSGYYRYYTKTSVKEGSTVKLPTAAELETYKEPAKAPDEEK